MFRCLKLFILAMVAGCVIFFGHGFLLEKMGYYLLAKDELRPADAIVVLAGEDGERVDYGARLFKEGWARKDRIVMSGGPAVWKFTWADLMKRQAESLGIPGRDVLLEDKSRSTVENARYSRELIRKNGFKSIILVTSPYHSKRASQIFRKVLGNGFTVISAPADRSWFSFDRWWKRARDRDAVLSEYSKFLRLWIFGVD